MKTKCYVYIQAGAGGDDTKRQAETLLRHFLKYCERNKFKYEAEDLEGFDLCIEGENAYETIKKLEGIHRVFTLEKGKRHTCFCSFRCVKYVTPESVNIDWDKEVEFQAIRGTGAGGQKVNKTSSCIRVFYKPLKITLVARDERSQTTNKRNAMARLASIVSDYYTPEAERFRGVMTFGKNDFTYWDHEMKDWWKKV